MSWYHGEEAICNHGKWLSGHPSIVRSLIRICLLHSCSYQFCDFVIAQALCPLERCVTIVGHDGKVGTSICQDPCRLDTIRTCGEMESHPAILIL